MAINLEKMLRDLQTGDEDIKVLALGTLLQYDFTPLAAQRGTLVKIRTLLDNSPDSFGGDMGFLYRQVVEKLRGSPLLVETTVDGADASLPAARPAAPASPAPPSAPPSAAPPSPAPPAPSFASLPVAAPGAAVDLTALRTGTPAQQVACLMDVKKSAFGGARAEVLELMTRTQDERVLASCISALTAVGTKDDVPRLRPFLGHPDGRVRANAVETVERIGTPLQLLIFVAPLTRDFNKRARTNALQALARLGREGIVHALTALLKHPNVNLRGNALYVLENFQGDDANAVLQLALRDQSEFIRMEALNLLRRRPGAASRALVSACLQDPTDAVRKLAQSVLQAMDRGDAPPGIERVDLTGLATHLDPEEPLPDLGSLRSADVEAQLATLEKVTRNFVDEAHGYVVEILRSARDPRLVEACVRALAAVGSREDVATLVQLLRHDVPSVRRAAVDAVGQVGAPRDILTWLTPALMTDDRALREQAMAGLMRFRPQVLLEHFHRLLAAPQVPVRVTGLWALACFGGEASQKLLTPLAGDPSPEIRSQLARALSLRREPWAMLVLERLVGDTVVEVGAQARRSLALQRGETEPVEAAPAAVSVPAAEAPPLSQAEVAEVAEAASEVDEEDMLSKSFVGNLAGLQAGGTLSTLFGKLSAKKHSSLAELSELDKRQRGVYEAMGKKLFDASERGNLPEADFRNAIFVVKKYQKLRTDRQKQRGQAGATGSFLASLLGGSGAATEDDKDIEVTLRQQYVFLGKTAWRLHKEQGRAFDYLKEEILDIKALEERIGELMAEDGGK